MGNPRQRNILSRYVLSRHLRCLALCLPVLLLNRVHPLFAQDYPNRPIRLVVPTSPGGPYDPVARMIGQKLTEILLQPVVIDFKPGATGSIGTDNVAKSAPDGYSLLFMGTGFAIAPSISAKLPFDPVKDFAAISLLTTGTDVLVANPAVPVKSVKELLALARQKPGKLTYASSGTGGPLHLHAELFKSMARIDMLHVPYKGAGPAVVDVIGGHVDLMFVGVPAVLAHIRNAKLRALGVCNLERFGLLPEVPTISESGGPGFVASPFSGMLAPAGTSQEVIVKINSALVRILQTPDMKERLAILGIEPKPTTPAQFSAYLQEQIAKWARAVRAAGIKPE